MPLKKLADAPKPCLSREHNPPSHMVYEPGTWEWTCPSCGKKTVFTVPRIVCHYDGKQTEMKVNTPVDGWKGDSVARIQLRARSIL